MVQVQKRWLKVSEDKSQFSPLYSQEQTVEINGSNERVKLVLRGPGTIYASLFCFFISFIFNCKFVPMSKKWISEITKLQSKSFFHTQFATQDENLSSHPKNIFSGLASCNYQKGRGRVLQ